MHVIHAMNLQAGALGHHHWLALWCACLLALCCTVLCRAVPCCAVPCRAVPCCAMLFYVVLCCVVLCSLDVQWGVPLLVDLLQQPATEADCAQLLQR